MSDLFQVKPRKYYDGSQDWLQKISIDVPVQWADGNPMATVDAVTIFCQDRKVTITWCSIAQYDATVAEKMGQALLKAAELARKAEKELEQEAK